MIRGATMKKPEPFDRDAERRKDDVRGATRERMARAGEDYEVGDDPQTRIYVLKDIPIDRMFKRRAITGVVFSSLQRFRHHWYHSGLIPRMGSVDLNRVFASDPASISGMPGSEAQAHHRREWRSACAELDRLGHHARIVVDNVVCSEQSLEIAGYCIGYTSKPRAVEGASKLIAAAGERLARFWGIG